MTTSNPFKRIEDWQSALGLLCVPLKEDVEGRRRYILLNGLAGNFCLDFGPSDEPLSHRIAAWSSDVGHYVAVNEDTVTVHRWDRPVPTERYHWASIAERIHAFHRFLERDEPDRTKSVVAHILRVFRTLRAALDERVEAPHSLEALLYMLACAAGHSERSELDSRKWGLSSDAVAIANALPDATWDSVYSDLIGSGRYDVLRPDFELVLRHASGTLFQEAHFQARVSPNPWLPGLERPVRVNAGAQPTETGVYFTPSAIARSLAEEALNALPSSLSGPITIFDPACGSGELLRESLRLLHLKGYRGNVTVLGFDSSALAVAMARFALAAEGRYWAPNQVQVDVRQHDSLLVPWPSDVNIVIMNPPFQSWQRMDSDTQEAVTRVLGKRLANKPNLAMAFAIRAVQAVNSNTGVLAMVVPSSLLEAGSGRPVREVLSERLHPLLIGKLGDQRAFAHAFVDAGLYVGTTCPSLQRDAAVIWAAPQPQSMSGALRGLRRWRGAEVEPLKEPGFSVYLRERIGTSGAPWLARNYDSWRTFEAARQSKATIAAQKLFDIRQGVRLGSDVFIIDRERFRSLPPAEQRFFRPAVMNPSISEGRLIDSYYVFYPYSVGLPLIDTEDALAKNLNTYYTTALLPAKPKLSGRKSLQGDQRGWWELIRPRLWQWERQAKIVSKYFGDARPFAVDQAGDYVVVVGHAWLPHTPASDSRLTPKEVQFATLAYLNSTVAKSLLEYVSVHISGGQVDLSNKYVKDLPVLNLPRIEDEALNQLVAFGRAITEGTIERWTDLDDCVMALLRM